MYFFKVQSLGTKIGYPDFIMKPKEAHDKYKDLTITAANFFENQVNAAVFDGIENRKRLLKPVDKTEWGMTASTVNAYYTPLMNEIVFPAGILQTPFYNAEDPMYLNYGAIGMVVGHELTHAFDDSGRKYDSKGRLHDWWTETTASQFESKAQCFIEQVRRHCPALSPHLSHLSHL